MVCSVVLRVFACVAVRSCAMAMGLVTPNAAHAALRYTLHDAVLCTYMTCYTMLCYVHGSVRGLLLCTASWSSNSNRFNSSKREIPTLVIVIVILILLNIVTVISHMCLATPGLETRYNPPFSVGETPKKRLGVLFSIHCVYIYIYICISYIHMHTCV